MNMSVQFGVRQISTRSVWFRVPLHLGLWRSRVLKGISAASLCPHHSQARLRPPVRLGLMGSSRGRGAGGSETGNSKVEAGNPPQWLLSKHRHPLHSS